MALTLEQAKLLTQNKLAQQVIDELNKDKLLSMLVFDDSATASGMQSFTYTWNKIVTQPVAGTRNIGDDYTAQETVTELKTAQLGILGGKFTVDRAIAKYGNGVKNHLAFQMEQKIKAVKQLCSAKFVQMLDDQADDSMKITTAINLSTPENISSNYLLLSDAFRDAEALMTEEPTVWLVAREMYAVIQKCADRMPGFYMTKDDNGKAVVSYNGVPIVRLGEYSVTSGSVAKVIPTDATSGCSAIYGVTLGLEGAHGVTPTGSIGIDTYLSNTDKNANANIDGAVEMLVAFVLKNTRLCSVITGVQIAPAVPSVDDAD